MKDQLVMLLFVCDSQLSSPATVTSSAGKRAMVKMLAVKFNATETSVHVAFNLHAWHLHLLRHAQCALYHKTHTQF
jgi:hypothetical protein